jgi:hypothetical protein
MREASQEAIMRPAIIAVCAAAVFLALNPARAQAPLTATSPENLTAARELIQVMKATEQFKAVLPVIVQNLKPAIVQNRPEVEKVYDAMMPLFIQRAQLRFTELSDSMAGIYASNFTVDEMHDMVAFYKSPTGQKLLERQPTIARDSMAAGQQLGRAVVSDIKDAVAEELRKNGDAK